MFIASAQSPSSKNVLDVPNLNKTFPGLRLISVVNPLFTTPPEISFSQNRYEKTIGRSPSNSNIFIIIKYIIARQPMEFDRARMTKPINVLSITKPLV